MEVLTRSQAEARRRALLASVGGNEESLRERAADYMLTAAELAALTEIDGLDYLLRSA